jgi:hypothetical protein
MSDVSVFTKTRRPTVYWGINASLTKTQELLIPSGTATSAPLDMTSQELHGYLPVAVLTPATWTSAKLAIQISVDNVSWFSVHQWLTNGPFDTSNAVAANQCHIIDGYVLRGIPYVRFISGTVAVPVNQAANRILTIICSTV